MKNWTRKGFGMIAIAVVAFLLVSSTPGWADTKLYVRKAADGALTIWKYDVATATPRITPQPISIPNSCYTPELFWDTDLGAWVLNGFDDSMNLAWTGAVNVSGVFSMAGTPPAIVCGTPGAVTTTSSLSPGSCAFTYTDYGTCQTDDYQYRTVVSVSPPGCVGGLPVLTQSCTWTAPACTAWTYSAWGVCQSDSTQTRNIVSSLPSGCEGGSPVLSQSCVPPVNGTCGSSQGQTLASAPTSGLCSTGTAGTVSGTGPWTWTCTGSNGGTNANCSANPNTPVNGVCGTSNGQTLTAAPTSGLCTVGNASVVSGTGPWSWTCSGANGGANVNCSASLAAAPGPTGYIPMELNCATGTASGVSKGYVLYSFTIPAGTYNAIYVMNQQSISYAWSEQVVIMKDGNVTKADYDALMALYNDPLRRNNYAMGENNMWYGLKRAGDTLGITFSLSNSGDGVIKTTSGRTTVTRDVPFTVILVAGDVGGGIPSSATHKVRYCVQ
ncbi:MAG: hypothetical protein ACYC69_07595 [Thermodesulfovibrionales bacterium]